MCNQNLAQKILVTHSKTDQQHLYHYSIKVQCLLIKLIPLLLHFCIKTNHTFHIFKFMHAFINKTVLLCIWTRRNSCVNILTITEVVKIQNHMYLFFQQILFVHLICDKLFISYYTCLIFSRNYFFNYESFLKCIFSY